MQIREGRPPRSGQLKRVGVELGRAAKARLTWMDYYRATENVALTCRHFGISTSMLGRILLHLQRQGRLVEPPRTGVPGSRRALRPRPYAVRKPKQYAVSQPGDLVEVDTLEVRLRCRV